MCSNETNYENSNWTSIQSGKTQNGTCIDNYYGYPTRQCFQNGSNNPIGVWNSIIYNPCQGIICFCLLYCFSVILTTTNNSNHMFK